MRWMGFPPQMKRWPGSGVTNSPSAHYSIRSRFTRAETELCTLQHSSLTYFTVWSAEEPPHEPRLGLS